MAALRHDCRVTHSGLSLISGSPAGNGGAFFWDSYTLNSGVSAIRYLGLGFPWQLMWFAPERATLEKVQNSSAPDAVLRRQIEDVPCCCRPLAI